MRTGSAPIAVHSRSTVDDGVLAAPRRRADHAALPLEQERAGGVGADPLGAGDRVAGDEGARPQLRLDRRDRRRLDAPDVEDDGAAAPARGAIVGRRSPRLRTGVASTTSAAPRAASAADGAARSMIPSACARSSLSRVRLQATTSLTAPATRAPSATEPPICPTPITAIRPSAAPDQRRCVLTAARLSPSSRG